MTIDMTPQQDLTEIQADVNNISERVQKLHNDLGKYKDNFQKFNDLVNQSNTMLLEHLKKATHGTLNNRANDKLSSWQDSESNHFIKEGKKYEQEVQKVVQDFNSARAKDSHAIQQISESLDKLEPQLAGLERIVAPDVKRTQLEPLQKTVTTAKFTIADYVTGLPEANKAATADMTVTELGTITSQSLEGTKIREFSLKPTTRTREGRKQLREAKDAQRQREAEQERQAEQQREAERQRQEELERQAEQQREASGGFDAIGG